MNEEQRDKIQQALDWFGINATPDDCDVCEDGSAYFHLTQILPKGQLC